MSTKLKTNTSEYTGEYTYDLYGYDTLVDGYRPVLISLCFII